jgi:hypothetical protein
MVLSPAILYTALISLSFPFLNNHKPQRCEAFKKGQWQEVNFKNYRFILERDLKIRHYVSSESGKFREYYDSTNWMNISDTSSKEILVFQNRKNSQIKIIITVVDGTVEESLQRDIFESRYKSAGFKIQDKSYGLELVNNREFKSVIYVLTRTKGYAVSYNMFFTGASKTIILQQICQADDYIDAYHEFLELVSGLEVGSQI